MVVSRMLEFNNKYINGIFQNHIEFQRQFFNFVWRNMTRKHQDVILGWTWALLRPLIPIFVFWFPMKSLVPDLHNFFIELIYHKTLSSG